MPVWLSILIAIGGFLLGSVGSFFGFQAYFSERARHKAAEKNKQEDAEKAAEEAKQRKLDEIEEKEFMDKLVAAVTERLVKALFPQIKELIGKELDEKLAPINEKLDTVESDLGKVKSGVQDTCRNDLEMMVDKADANGYMTRYDKDRFDHMYKSYHALGENGVMDASHERVLALPEAKPRRRSSKSK